MKTLLIILLVPFWLGRPNAQGATARDSFPAREVELTSFEYHADKTLNLERPLYRLGEILKTRDDRWVVPVDYFFNGREWIYSVVGVKVGQ